MPSPEKEGSDKRGRTDDLPLPAFQVPELSNAAGTTISNINVTGQLNIGGNLQVTTQGGPPTSTVEENAPVDPPLSPQTTLGKLLARIGLLAKFRKAIEDHDLAGVRLKTLLRDFRAGNLDTKLKAWGFDTEGSRVSYRRHTLVQWKLTSSSTSSKYATRSRPFRISIRQPPRPRTHRPRPRPPFLS